MFDSVFTANKFVTLDFHIVMPGDLDHNSESVCMFIVPIYHKSLSIYRFHFLF